MLQECGLNEKYVLYLLKDYYLQKILLISPLSFIGTHFEFSDVPVMLSGSKNN